MGWKSEIRFENACSGLETSAGVVYEIVFSMNGCISEHYSPISSKSTAFPLCFPRRTIKLGI